MNNIDETINRNLASIESKLDAMIVTLAARPAIIDGYELRERIGEVETNFRCSLSALAVLQGKFCDDDPNDANVYYSIESVKREIKTAYQILTAGTGYTHSLDHI